MEDREWHEARRTGIGSSDAAAVCGVNPFKTSFEVYLEKVGEAPPRPPRPEMEWGLRLEPVIAQAFTDRTGIPLVLPPRIRRHPLLPWMIASLDRLTEDGKTVVELKAAFSREGWGREGTDEIPPGYILQVQHQLAVYGLAHARVAALLLGHDFRIYDIPRNNSLIGRMMEMERDFWDQVQHRHPPDLDLRHPSALPLLEELYGVEPGKGLVLSPELGAAAAAFLAAQEQARAAGKAADAAKAALLQAMGDAAEATSPDGTTVRRRKVRRAEYRVPTTEYVRFTVHPPKEGGTP